VGVRIFQLTIRSPIIRPSAIRRAALVGALVASSLGAAQAERVALRLFETDDSAMRVALPAAITRALESIDGVVIPPPTEVASYLALRPKDEAQLTTIFDLDGIVTGKLDGKAGDYTLKLTATMGAKDSSATVKGKDFPALVVAADAALIKLIGIKATANDMNKLAAVERALPSADVAATAATAADASSLAALEKAGENAWVLAVRGLVLAQTNKPADGLPLAARAAKLAPLDVNVQVMCAATQVLAGKPADAKPVLEAALKLNAAKPEAHYLSGLVRLRTADAVNEKVLRDAGEAFVRALQYNPRLTEAGLGLADVQVRLGDPKSAQRTLGSLVQRMPEELRLHDRLIGLMLQDDKETALRYLQTVVKQVPDVPEGVYALATRLFDTPAALEIVKLGEAKYPTSAAMALSRGTLLERQGGYEDAAKAYKLALERDDKLDRAGLALAACLAKLGRFDEAEAALSRTQAGKASPKAKVRMYLQSGRLERATPALSGLNATTDPEVSYLQGVLALRDGRFDDAQKAFEAAIKTKPDFTQAKLALTELGDARRIGVPKLEGDVQFRYRLAQAAMDSANPLEAVTALQAVLKAAPNTAQASFLLGVALYESGLPDDAITAFQTASRGLANNPVVLTNTGVAYLEVGRFDLALENLTKSTQADAKYARGWYFLGVTNFQLGYAAPAKDAFLKAVALDSNLKDEIQRYLNSLPK
jgi:tetratricopeptide (TPR) repeat protein